MKRLEGKVAVVTAGNSGIGLAAAKRLQEEGARVAIAGRSKKTLDETAKTIGNGVLAVQADVVNLADVDKLYAEVAQKLGKIDVLFVNAGVAKFAPLAETSESLYDEQFGIKSSTTLSGENCGGRTGGARHPREHGCAGTDCDSNLWENRVAQGSH